MLTEISSCDLEDRDDYARRLSGSCAPFPSFHERIFTQTDSRLSMRPTATSFNQTDEKIRGAFGTTPVAADLHIKTGIEIDWGGKEGTSWTASASATARDDNGNGAQIRAQIHEDGRGNIAVFGTHDSDSNNPSKGSNPDPRDN